MSRTTVSQVRGASAIAIQLERIASALERLSIACGGTGPKRVFLSHTSELRDQAGDGSFVAAAEAAVVRAGHAVVDMAHFAARDLHPADYCVSMMARANVYVGIIGHRYGSTVSDRSGQSFTELEFETATSLGMPRLVYLVGERASSAPRPRQSATDRARQRAFRRRLMSAGLTVVQVNTPGELQVALHQSLVEMAAWPPPDGTALRHLARSPSPRPTSPPSGCPPVRTATGVPRRCPHWRFKIGPT